VIPLHCWTCDPFSSVTGDVATVFKRWNQQRQPETLSPSCVVKSWHIPVVFTLPNTLRNANPLSNDSEVFPTTRKPPAPTKKSTTLVFPPNKWVPQQKPLLSWRRIMPTRHLKNANPIIKRAICQTKKPTAPVNSTTWWWMWLTTSFSPFSNPASRLAQRGGIIIESFAYSSYVTFLRSI